MAASESLRFHKFCGKDVVLSRCRTQAYRLFVITRALIEVLDGDPGSPGTEVAYSHRPIQAGEMVTLLFGKNLKVSWLDQSRRKVTLGFTTHDPSTLSCVPKISELTRLPGYWVSELAICLRYRLQFSFDSSGQIYFSDTRRSWAGPRVGETNIRLWAVLSIPKHGTVEFDREPIPSRVLNNAIRMSSSHRGAVPVTVAQSATHSIPSSSNQSSSTPHQGEGTSSSSCIICCNRPADTALSPCGHMYTCHDCALDLWQGRGRGSCPTCRKQITNVLRVYRD